MAKKLMKGKISHYISGWTFCDSIFQENQNEFLRFINDIVTAHLMSLEWQIEWISDKYVLEFHIKRNEQSCKNVTFKNVGCRVTRTGHFYPLFPIE